MLVLSRKLNETIVIDGGIEITIIKVRGDNVRLGIKAPKDVVVDRKEVAESKNRQNIEIH
jgi:carbon storage regulator